MRKKYTVLTFLLFLSVLIFSFPMRGLAGILDNQDFISIESGEGFWWKGHLRDVQLNNQRIGDINISYKPLAIFLGKFKFRSSISEPGISLEGFFGKTLLGDTFIEELEITLLPNIKKNNTKIDLDNIVNLIGKIDFLVFDQRQCIKASGNGIAEVKDMFGLIPKSIKLDFFLSCTDSNIKIVFTSGKDGLLEGNVLIKDFYEYELEATSNRLADRIKELSKLNFKKEPSIKFSGNLQQLF